MKRWLTTLAALLVSAGASHAGPGQFEGKIVVEWLDDNPFAFTMRLQQDFAYRDTTGKVWHVPGGETLDGRSIPPLFIDRIGHPFDGSFRKSAIVYDYTARTMTEPWEQAQKMFYEAAVTEGVPSSEAKAMYLTLIAQGSRWEIAGSRCFSTCHGKSGPLEWRPVADEERLAELLNWVRASDPDLEEIEARAKTAILDKGPHVFPQQPCARFSGSTRIRGRC